LASRDINATGYICNLTHFCQHKVNFTQ